MVRDATAISMLDFESPLTGPTQRCMPRPFALAVATLTIAALAGCARAFAFHAFAWRQVVLI